MVGGKKQLVSVRLCHADVERIQALASRLRVRESDVIRFALRLAFNRLAPLLDEQARGRDLIPIFLECGPELTYHFDLEPRTLEAIVNGGLDDPERKVDSHDIELMAALHLPGYHLPARLKFQPKPETGHLPPPSGLQQYLYDKYVQPESVLGRSDDSERPSTAPARNRAPLPLAAALDEAAPRP
jgi:hypothetical protein